MQRGRTRVSLSAVAGAVLIAVGIGIRLRRLRRNHRGDGGRRTMLETNKAIASRIIRELYNEGRLDAADELVSPGFVGHDSALPAPIIGASGIKASAAAYRQAFPDLEISIAEQIGEDDRVVTRWEASGTHEGDFFGVASTGKQVTVTGITVDRYADGLLIENWTNWDTLGLLMQLGVVPDLVTA
jgi:steroid delta-isomerase-like uncharacterized protein